MCFVAIATALGAPAAAATTIGTVATGVTTMLTVGSKLQQGQEDKKQADTTAKEIERDNRMAEVEAKQKSRDLVNSYLEDSNSNSAFFSYLGIDESESIKAFERKQESIILEQERRMKTQDTLRSSRSALEAATVRRSGANALAASQIDALSTAVTAGENLSKIRKPRIDQG